MVVLVGSKAGAIYRVGEHETILGRSPCCDIELPDDGVSRQHAKLIREGLSRVSIIDLGSTNGTFVDKRAITRETLRDGERFELGGTLLKIYFGDDLEESLHRNLYESSVRDTLTGLFNRRHCEERLATEFSYASRHTAPLSLILFDLDHFKRINNRYDYKAGDDVLRDVAEALRNTTRSEDLTARIRGEEFVIIARETSSIQAWRLAERVRCVVEGLAIQPRVADIRVTVSGGVACFNPMIFLSPESMLEAAGQALYQAKKSGRNKVVLYEEPEDFGVREENR